jgi:hypothetical protein
MDSSLNEYFLLQDFIFEMHEIQQIISAGAKTGISSKKYPSHQQLLWDLNPSYSKG